MEIPVNRPGTADTVERELVYNYYTLKKGIYGQQESITNPYFFVENEGTYPMPICAERIIWTPGDKNKLIPIPEGMYWIASIALPIMPNHGADGNAIWNYIKNATP
jgi:hypothetical protein